MASSPGFQSSPQSYGMARKKSQFTYRHLSLLTSYSTSSPLRVVAHIDLDAFYAQCEMVRLALPEDQPLAVQQWQGLIAVNYPAREYGIGRHCPLPEAKKLCPKLITQHVATWKEGDETWAYHDDAAAHIGTHKVSLDPYRLESRKILALIKDFLPADKQKVEKASIDEVFIDLSAHIHAVLLDRFPELANPPPYDDPTEKLPLPPVSALDWQADALVDLDNNDAEVEDPDWDDVAILVGSEIVRDVRAQVRRVLGYTCSAGIASNKMLSKLGSGYKKPNQQTVIRNRAATHFLSDMKFTKIRMLGGKLGEQVVGAFDTDTIRELLEVPVEQMKRRLGDDTGVWLYNTIRGIDSSEVNSRTQIKSMLSAKSFRPSVNGMDQAVKWLRIFSADIFSRLVEEGVLEGRRRPKTINLHHRQAGQTRSRSSAIPQGKPPDETILFDLAKSLLGQIVAEGRAWPCANLSLSVSGFEDGMTGNMGIGAFLVKGAGAATATGPKVTQPAPLATPVELSHRPDKRRRVDEGSSSGIQHFFAKQQPQRQQQESSPTGPSFPVQETDDYQNEEYKDGVPPTTSTATSRNQTQHPTQPSPQQQSAIGEAEEEVHSCSRCDASFHGHDGWALLQDHSDWHLARDLQDEEAAEVRRQRGERTLATASSAAGRGGTRDSGSGRGRGGRGGKKLEHGQSRLKFG